MNNGWTYCDRISKTSAGQTVLAYYSDRYRHSSKAEWQTRIADGQILLNGQPTDGQTILRSGHRLSYRRSPWQESDVPLGFDVLYEDEHLWVIAKPSGLPVLPGGGFLEHTLLHQLRSRYPNQAPIPVHRLGRGTSGAMLIAKSHSSRDALARQFRTRTATQNAVAKDSAVQDSAVVTPDNAQTLTKIYRALIGPAMVDEPGDSATKTLPERFICRYPIGKLPHQQLGYIYGHSANGLPARSDCTVMQRTEAATLVDVSISTGRLHQIRIHLAAAGFPLIGDPLYPVGGVPAPNCTARPGDVGYCLHAHQLRFVHPHSGKPVSITAPLPSVLQTDLEMASVQTNHKRSSVPQK
ncbi:MAG: pseudouridine synthase [Cyanobacteria bacterium J06634_6]